jgi:hypothetical protein
MENCAWCGDPGDENGSHGICPTHLADMMAQLETRRAARQATDESGQQTDRELKESAANA